MDTPQPAGDGELLKVLTRLMTPFRREFQQSLDVNRLLVDQGYAQEILEKIQHSDTPSIVSAREFLRTWMHGDSPVTPTASPHANSPLPTGAPPPVALNPATPAEGVVPAAHAPAVPDTKYVRRLR